MLVNPQHPHACEAGGVIRCGLQTRLDMGPHGIPRGCQLSSQASDSGSLETQLSDRPADRPHTQTRPRRAHPLVMFQEYHRLAGVFAAYPSPLMPPEPCRDPGPGRVNHRHHHTTVTLSDKPTTRAPRQLVARLNIEHQGHWGASHAHQMEALQTDEQITPITTIKRRRAAAGRVRHRPRSFEDRGGRSPLIIKDLDLYPQPPTNTRAPTLNSEEPLTPTKEDPILPLLCHGSSICWYLLRRRSSSAASDPAAAHDRVHDGYSTLVVTVNCYVIAVPARGLPSRRRVVLRALTRSHAAQPQP